MGGVAAEFSGDFYFLVRSGKQITIAVAIARPKLAVRKIYFYNKHRPICSSFKVSNLKLRIRCYFQVQKRKKKIQ